MEAIPSARSRTIKTAQIFPPDANAYGTLFGGKLMAHIDDVAAIAAARHARQTIVTASTDSVDFLAPVKVGDTIMLEAFVTSTHKTSMEIFVKATKESLLTGDTQVFATAFLTFVALDEAGKPTEVASVYPETEMEKVLYTGAEARRKHRNERRKQSQQFAEIMNE